MLCITAKSAADGRDGFKLGHPGDVRCMTAVPPKAEVHPPSCYVANVPIVFSNSGFRCQALRGHPCRAHCSLRGRGLPSA